ncbi:MAG: hypothetical protein M1834_009447 [Cirrosporium novae-zelandiae]|nr:MAG: hypothetical protein M1834_009447 [Cirrosporium novae-zelandiae]
MSTTTPPQPPKPTVLILGTLDTKVTELLYLRSQIQAAEVSTLLLDVGVTPTSHPAINITQHDILSSCPTTTTTNLTSLSRSAALATLATAATYTIKTLHATHRIHAIVAAGGSCNTSLAASVMREALSIGFPKLIVSTVAAGDVRTYVGETDLALMHSVVDVMGLNGVLRAILSNAAGAVAGMAGVEFARQREEVAEEKEAAKKEKEGKRELKKNKFKVGITMFGVTTPAVTAAKSFLDSLPTPEFDFEIESYVFHAVGTGGAAMERLITTDPSNNKNTLDAVLDLTTTELADQLVGGVFPAGPKRLLTAAEVGIPQIVSLGACDIVNFGAWETVPSGLRDSRRRLVKHNEGVTLMRVEKSESEELGRRIAERLREGCRRPGVVEVWVPLRGVSAIGVEGEVFFDKEADRALFEAVRGGLEGSGVKVREVDAEINDPGFAVGMARRLVELLRDDKERG